MESAPLLLVTFVKEPLRVRREAQGADFGDSARRDLRVHASLRLDQPWQQQAQIRLAAGQPAALAAVMVRVLAMYASNSRPALVTAY